MLGTSDMLWDSETSPDGGVVIHRSARDSSIMRLETVKGNKGHALKTSSICGLILFVLVYITFVGVCVILLVVGLFEDIAEGPGIILLILMELPLMAGAFLPLTAMTFVHNLRPLITSERLELKGQSFEYEEKLPFYAHHLFRAPHQPSQIVGNISQLAGVELKSYPPDSPQTLYLMPGVTFGTGITTHDSQFICEALQDHLRSLNVQLVSYSERMPIRPAVTTALYQEQLSGDILMDFPGAEGWRKIVGFSSLWALPLALGVPIIYFAVEASEKGHQEAEDEYILPMLVWGLIHGILYIVWVLQDLTAVRLKFLASNRTFEFSHTLFLLPNVRIPFIMLGWGLPRRKIIRNASDVVAITREPVLLHKKEVAQQLAFRFRVTSSTTGSEAAPLASTESSAAYSSVTTTMLGSSTDRQLVFMLPPVPFHETWWLQQLLLGCALNASTELEEV